MKPMARVYSDHKDFEPTFSLCGPLQDEWNSPSPIQDTLRHHNKMQTGLVHLDEAPFTANHISSR